MPANVHPIAALPIGQRLLRAGQLIAIHLDKVAALRLPEPAAEPA
jgi:hypothetical protein